MVDDLVFIFLNWWLADQQRDRSIGVTHILLLIHGDYLFSLSWWQSNFCAGSLLLWIGRLSVTRHRRLPIFHLLFIPGIYKQTDCWHLAIKATRPTVIFSPHLVSLIETAAQWYILFSLLRLDGFIALLVMCLTLILKPPYVLHIDGRSVINKRKETLIYS
jgi:hypothetical protein